MAITFEQDLQLNNDYTYSINYPSLVQPPITNVFTGDVTTVITTINGNSGQATGPAITLSGGVTGYDFVATSGNVTLTVANAATARAAIGAAKSGANADINTFSALTGNTGWSAWTGGSDKTSHATYSGTASVGYVQAELQGVMDSLKQMTEAYKALQDVLLGIGITEA